ncbi:autotransporter outer membrane beta-barrel domain-containing protein [Jeongeupia sp. HS-3]|uniref:autotransporter outer membrane beta-barrel domain-containing protein n=1 Tax=Jeongeupia sp. HS-3 TaxID=1009682 RepID=UPI001910E09D|nr:autotransporter outer membrane beta-barrel domain-containing protein [Jeongeupia sp. HS-3]
MATAGGVGIDSSGTRSGETVKLGATGTTGLAAGAGENIQFDTGRVESSALNAAQAKDQLGFHAMDGGHIAASGSTVMLEPKTAAGAVFTANDMTGVKVETGGTVTLTDTSVVVGGGAKGNNNRGVVITGPGSELDMRGGSVGTSSWGAVGILVEDGGSAFLSNGATMTTTGARSAATGGSHGVRVTGADSQLHGRDITVTTSGGSAYGMRVDAGGRAELIDATVNTAGGNGHGVLADGAEVDIDGGAIGTTGKGSVGVWARNGATIALSGTEVRTSGAAVSTASPVDGEKALSLSHGLLATGVGTIIAADDVSLLIGGTSASAARAEDGARITLTDSAIDVSSGATSTTTTAALHATGAGQIVGSGLAVNASGVNVGGVRAEGAGSSVMLDDSVVDVSGAGSVANPAAAARALDGGRVVIDHSTLTAEGQYGHGVSVEGAGSQAEVSDSDISVGGNRAIGLNITGGASGKVDNSRITTTAVAGAVGPFAPGVLVEGTGSRLMLDKSDVHTTQKSSHGLQVSNGAEVAINSGSITTDGNYSTGIGAGHATVTANNVTVTTHGNDNAMGVVANDASTVTLNGGSVTTTGSGSPVQSNMTFPHALASRNPGALLIASGTSVLTLGTQAYGAAVDDGGSMVLSDLAVKTEGAHSIGLYAGIGSIKPGQVRLDANNVSVETLGDHAAGALTSRRYQQGTAVLNLADTTIRTHGLQSHGLQAESGAALSASNTVVSTTGIGALGAVANNTATIGLDVVGVATSGNLAHGVVAKQGGTVDGRDVVVTARGEQAAALYVQGTDALKGTANLENAVLSNRDGATVAVAGVGDVALQNAIVGGSGQWLYVDRSLASAGTAIPDMGTGQWQGVGQSFDSVGRAKVDLAGSVVTGSANTAASSRSTVTLRDTSIWKLTGNSNLSTLSNSGSLIDFSKPQGGQYKHLTVNDYHGDNGTLALNTYLYGDGSPSDRLVIDGGKASGGSNLRISNAGGAGALTTGNGIMVVDAINGGATEAQAFRLLAQVKAGPYEYTLHRASLDASNGEAWYLRSTKDAVDVPAPINESKDAGGEVPTPPQVPNYRPETSLYSGIPALALRYGRMLVDTLHERVGEERRRSVDPLPPEDRERYEPSLGWGRLIYQRGDDRYGAAEEDYTVRAMQLGLDLYRGDAADGSTDQAGVSANLGKIEGRVTHDDGRHAGDNRLRAWGLGGYWTHFWPAGGYLDGVLQFNRYLVEAQPTDMAALETRGRGVTASLEVGYPYQPDEHKTRYIEPQAQLIYSRVRLDDAHDAAADVRFDQADSLTGRVGVRLHRDWFRVDDNGKVYRSNGWIRPSLWHEFKGRATTALSSRDGAVPFTADMGGTWGELNVGFDHEASKDATLSGTLGYQQSLDGDGSSYEAMIEAKIRF